MYRFKVSRIAPAFLRSAGFLSITAFLAFFIPGNSANSSAAMLQTPTRKISGRILNTGTAISGVTMTLSGTQTATVTTDLMGNYSFTNLPDGGNYTVTPSKTNYSFTPASRTFSNLTADQTSANFDAAQLTVTISGQVHRHLVGIGGVPVTLSGSASATTTTNGGGIFTFSNLPVGGNYTVTAGPQENFKFAPPGLILMNVTVDTFVHIERLPIYRVTGRVTDPQGNGVENVTMKLCIQMDPPSVCYLTGLTDSAGNYSFEFTALDINYSYDMWFAVYPTKAGHSFSPILYRTVSGIDISGKTVGSYRKNEPQSSGANLTAVSVVDAQAVGEGNGTARVTVTRFGTTDASTMSFWTADSAGLTECNVPAGNGSSRCDYATSIGTLNFAAGEASKTIYIPLVDDAYAEGNETFSLTLRHETGATPGSTSTSTITIQDNESTSGANPIDGNDFFIRQQYIDFLGREPDTAGLQGWRNVLNNCGTTVAQPCDRTEVSSGFFRSEEFQARGYFIYRFYSILGRIPLSGEFYPDQAKVSGFLTPEQLEANKAAFVTAFIARTEFQNKYAAKFNDPTAYVDGLLQTVGLPGHPSRANWITLLNSNNTAQNRATVLRQLVDSQEMFSRYYNEAFVIMQYFGYLRRTADSSYQNWIETMNATGGDYRLMINGFLNSSEYRRRFGP